MEKAARERGSPFVSPTKVCETKKNDSCVYGKGGVKFKGTDKGGLPKMDQKTLQEITLIDRTGTNSTKWDDLRASFGEDGLLPVWVADMDFKTPLCVRKPFTKQ